jgi:hypothetical protein
MNSRTLPEDSAVDSTFETKRGYSLSDFCFVDITSKPPKRSASCLFKPRPKARFSLLPRSKNPSLLIVKEQNAVSGHALRQTSLFED